jgi:hypothetical protein
MNYDAIRKLLDAQVDTVAGLPTRVYENQRYMPTTGTPWCRSTLLPAEPTAVTIGPNGQNQAKGLFQVDLLYPQSIGTTDANALASLIATALKRGTILVSGSDNVHVEMSWQQTAYAIQQVWYVVPVVIRWSSYTQ